MVGLDARDAHVARERLAGNDHRLRFLESQDREEFPRAVHIPHHDCQMIEMLEHDSLSLSLDHLVGDDRAAKAGR
jgi:hypothetical protein